MMRLYAILALVVAVWFLAGLATWLWPIPKYANYRCVGVTTTYKESVTCRGWLRSQ